MLLTAEAQYRFTLLRFVRFLAKSSLLVHCRDPIVGLLADHNWFTVEFNSFPGPNEVSSTFVDDFKRNVAKLLVKHVSPDVFGSSTHETARLIRYASTLGEEICSGLICALRQFNLKQVDSIVTGLEKLPFYVFWFNRQMLRVLLATTARTSNPKALFRLMQSHWLEEQQSKDFYDRNLVDFPQTSLANALVWSLSLQPDFRMRLSVSDRTLVPLFLIELVAAVTIVLGLAYYYTSDYFCRILVTILQDVFGVAAVLPASALILGALFFTARVYDPYRLTERMADKEPEWRSRLLRLLSRQAGIMPPSITLCERRRIKSMVIAQAIRRDELRRAHDNQTESHLQKTLDQWTTFDRDFAISLRQAISGLAKSGTVDLTTFILGTMRRPFVSSEERLADPAKLILNSLADAEIMSKLKDTQRIGTRKKEKVELAEKDLEAEDQREVRRVLPLQPAWLNFGLSSASRSWG